MEKLELERLLPYLPYNPMVEFLGSPSKEHYECLGTYSNMDYDEYVKLKVLKYGKIRKITIRKDYYVCHIGKAATFTKACYSGDFRLLLRPLSDLTKEIEVDGKRFVPIKEFYEIYGGGYQNFENWYDMNWANYSRPLECLSYNDLQKLFEWHFDVFGLTEKGYAIDINTIKA
jgi:hypothetical protein